MLENFHKLSRLHWFIEIKVIGPGSSFGEQALINDKPRAATITTLDECYFAVLGREFY
jgi:CRP-like cAMP-binding protein